MIVVGRFTHDHRQVTEQGEDDEDYRDQREPGGGGSQTKRLIDAVLSSAQENGAEIEMIDLIDRDFKV